MTSSRPCPSQTACKLEFRAPLVRPIRRETFPFLKGWQRFGAPSNGSRRSPAGRACRPWPPGLHPQPTPADEVIGDRLVRSVLLRRIAPAQIVADHENNTRDHPPIIDFQHRVRQRKIRLNPTHLCFLTPPLIHIAASPSIGPKPNLMSTITGIFQDARVHALLVGRISSVLTGYTTSSRGLETFDLHLANT